MRPGFINPVKLVGLQLKEEAEAKRMVYVDPLEMGTEELCFL